MQNYPKAISFLNSLLNLEQAGKPNSRIWNLKRMRELLRIFGRPERGIFAVLVAGTKGKGSTAYFLSEILRRSGLRVGFYQSPHLESPTERILINGKPVTKEKFAQGLLRIKRTLQHHVFARRPIGRRNNLRFEIVSGASLRAYGPKGPEAHPRNDGMALPFTYFEIMTLLAALLFKENQVDAAVYEVGMGGRLDATNALPAKLVILTPIHFDHEAYLGNTLAKIAGEKAAVLRRGGEAVIAPQPPEVKCEIERMARKRRCRLWSPLSVPGMKLRLLGDFQELNARMALRAGDILRKRYHFPVTPQAMLEGVASNHWPGRMELIRGHRNSSILLDGAHNPKSIEALTRNVKRLFGKRRKVLIFGTSRDKRSDRMLTTLSRVFDTCILTESQSSRAKETALLLREAQSHFQTLLPAVSVPAALALARRITSGQDLIVGTGSFYLIGELRSLCRN